MKGAAHFDIDAVDCEGFVRDLATLRASIDADLGARDLAHLRKIERWGRVCTAVGVATAGLAPNPISALCLALGRSTRWVIMHHVGHRGYDHVPGIPARYTSKVFARGGRRFVDFADWLTPASWVYEHNVLHHSHTAEMRDPDLIERNTEIIRALPLPTALRYVPLAILSVIWRPGFYAPMALRAWKERGKNKEDDAGQYDLKNITRSFFDAALWRDCYFPYALLQFVLLPLLFVPFGKWAVLSALCNSVAGEVLANVHSFSVVLPNHCGEDMYRYDARPSSRAQACVRQVVSSVNYGTGGDALDLSHLWLNYQIEHHIWPDLPMLRYREVQPEVRALCAKYGVPYVQESVFRRFKKMSDVVVGKTAMRRVATLA